MTCIKIIIITVWGSVCAEKQQEEQIPPILTKCGYLPLVKWKDVIPLSDICAHKVGKMCVLKIKIGIHA